MIRGGKAKEWWGLRAAARTKNARDSCRSAPVAANSHTAAAVAASAETYTSAAGGANMATDSNPQRWHEMIAVSGYSGTPGGTRVRVLLDHESRATKLGDFDNAQESST